MSSTWMSLLTSLNGSGFWSHWYQKWPDMGFFDFLRHKTPRNCQWPHPELYSADCVPYLVVLGPKMVIYWTVLGFYISTWIRGLELRFFDRYGIFWLSETQNPQKLSMTSSRIIFCWLCSLFGCSRSKNGDLLNRSRFLHIYVDPGLRTSLFWPIWGFWLSETQNPQKPSMTSCRIIFLRFWSTFGCSKAKIGNLHNHFEFFTYVRGSGGQYFAYLIRYGIQNNRLEI